MGNELFDGIVKTITKTTKEIGKATKEIGVYTERIVESQKLANKIQAENKIIEKIKVDIGDVLYRRYTGGDKPDSEISTLCQEIDQHYMKIKALKDKAANLSGEKICPSCGREVAMDASFCPYCGSACPTPQAHDKSEEAAEDEESGSSSNPEETEDASAEAKPQQEKCVQQPEETGAAEDGQSDEQQEQPVEEKQPESMEEETIEELPEDPYL